MLRRVGVPTKAAAFVAVLLLGCSSEPEGSTSGTSVAGAVTQPSAVSVALATAADTVVVGRRVRVTLVVQNASGTAVVPRAIDWAVADSGVAALAPDASGDRLSAQLSDASATSVYVAAVAPGTTTVSATADRRTASARVVVVPAPSKVARVSIAPTVDTTSVGRMLRFTLDTRDALGAAAVPREVTWTSRDTSIAIVATPASEASVLVAGLAPGTVRVDAVADGRMASATIVVLPRVAAIRMRRDTVRLHPGESTALVATPVDESGKTIPGQTIGWYSSDTTVAVVDADGVVTARAPRLASIVATIGGVSGSAPVTVRRQAGDVGTPAALDVATYDGSGQVVHPDVVRFDAPWNGYRYWMAITPYPNANDQLENPSVFGSDAGDDWDIPDGAVNPLARSQAGHLSDPALVFDDASKRLLLYYRDAIGGSAHSRDDVYLTSTGDGVHWAAPTLAYSDTGIYVLSPSVVRRPDGSWRVWAIDAGADGCRAGGTGVVMRTSSDGRRWSASRPVPLVQPGQNIWHIDVQWVASRKQYWALYAAYAPLATCGSTDLYLATSTDGERWITYPSPVLARGAVPAFELAVYRSTFAVDPTGDSVTVWLSGARRDTPRTTQWTAAIARTSVAALLARVAAPAAPGAPAVTIQRNAATRPDAMP